ncbi:MAG: SAM-dependent methyltransferase [Rhodococcus sp.]|nr:SAM-dependent methyltransferase [Rhodococcus sp. (in: high G+C Gram-positive bacteria)]
MARLTIVGTGLMAVRDLTVAAIDSLKSADMVFYLVADAITENYIKKLNASASSLFVHYAQDKDRNISYQEMIDRVVASLSVHESVCVAFYGHPGIFVYPSHEMIRIAKATGHDARMLPGISAEDWLFADIGVDPARTGCQSFEATDFLVHERVHDPRSVLVLWQVGVIGNMTWRQNYSGTGCEVLLSRLSAYYPSNHEVIIYEASEFVLGNPRIEACELSDLPQKSLTPISTLFIPPVGESIAKHSRLEELGLAIPQNAILIE